MKKPIHSGFDAPFLDKEEEEILRDVEAGLYVSTGSLADSTAQWKQIARNTLRKKPITIRVQERDIEGLKVKALEQGIPYQTLVASILHRYVKGTLKEDA